MLILLPTKVYMQPHCLLYFNIEQCSRPEKGSTSDQFGMQGSPELFMSSLWLKTLLDFFCLVLVLLAHCYMRQWCVVSTAFKVRPYLLYFWWGGRWKSLVPTIVAKLWKCDSPSPFLKLPVAPFGLIPIHWQARSLLTCSLFEFCRVEIPQISFTLIVKNGGTKYWIIVNKTLKLCYQVRKWRCCCAARIFLRFLTKTYIKFAPSSSNTFPNCVSY